jgi:hypothetical protein
MTRDEILLKAAEMVMEHRYEFSCHALAAAETAYFAPTNLVLEYADFYGGNAMNGWGIGWFNEETVGLRILLLLLFREATHGD